MSYQKKLRIERMAKMSKEKRLARKQGHAVVEIMRRLKDDISREKELPFEDRVEELSER